jgi:hypothetical protein
VSGDGSLNGVYSTTSRHGVGSESLAKPHQFRVLAEAARRTRKVY